MKIYCQICSELIATAKRQDLKAPLHGSMFKSPYPDRMPEAPLEPTEWEFLKCPHCKFRPFIEDDQVLTEDGIYEIVPEPTYVCETCGKDCKNKGGLTMHKKVHEWKV